jgi:hypothetical protein
MLALVFIARNIAMRSVNSIASVRGLLEKKVEKLTPKKLFDKV